MFSDIHVNSMIPLIMCARWRGGAEYVYEYLGGVTLRLKGVGGVGASDL